MKVVIGLASVLGKAVVFAAVLAALGMIARLKEDPNEIRTPTQLTQNGPYIAAR